MPGNSELKDIQEAKYKGQIINNQNNLKAFILEKLSKGCVYYWRGYFYFPLVEYLAISGELGKVRGAIRKFTKENKELIKQDRKIYPAFAEGEH